MACCFPSVVCGAGQRRSGAPRRFPRREPSAAPAARPPFGSPRSGPDKRGDGADGRPPPSGPAEPHAQGPPPPPQVWRRGRTSRRSPRPHLRPSAGLRRRPSSRGAEPSGRGPPSAASGGPESGAEAAAPRRGERSGPGGACVPARRERARVLSGVRTLPPWRCCRAASSSAPRVVPPPPPAPAHGGPTWRWVPPTLSWG